MAVGLLVGCHGANTAAQPSAAPQAAGGVERTDFGHTTAGQAVSLYTLRNSKGMVVKIMTYGATITEVDTPDRNGHVANVALGFDSVPEYEKSSPYFGATVGRYANRIAKGKFTLEGKSYTLAVNNGPNSLHGGKVGFDKVVWDAQVATGQPGPAVRFTHVSPDMDEGYPGRLSVEVLFTLTDNDALRIDYKATTDKPTVVNLTNHSYWNLSAFSSPTILDHLVMIDADKYTPVDATQIPTGEIKSVVGTPLDFRKPTAIGARIDQVTGGYDFNYVLNQHVFTSPPLGAQWEARVADPTTGRIMEMRTTEPGVQLYTANFLEGAFKGSGGQVYQKHAALCLEAQHFPDSPNEPAFPTTELKPGQTYTQTTIYQFSAR